jgi:hypothetical protein
MPLNIDKTSANNALKLSKRHSVGVFDAVGKKAYKLKKHHKSLLINDYKDK